jgi:aminoglycoside phosphotransferase
VRTLAAGLRQIHALDWRSCPFDERTAAKLATAQRRFAAGLVDEEDMDAFTKEVGPERLLRWLSEHSPETEDLVFTHGDYCLPNVLLNAESMHVSGYIDWGRAGVADRYQDLALAARSLTYNFGEQWMPLLWEAYGLDTVHVEKIEYFTLLDELY